MVTGRRKSERSTRQNLSSPGRPPVWQREPVSVLARSGSGLVQRGAVEAGISAAVDDARLRINLLAVFIPLFYQMVPKDPAFIS